MREPPAFFPPFFREDYTPPLHPSPFLRAAPGGRYLVEGHLPETLNQVAGARLATRVPPEYVKRTIASVLACKVVYQEGVTFVEQHTDAHLAPLAFDYLHAETQVQGVLGALDGLDWGAHAAAGAAARQIVKDGGIRSYLSRHGGFAK
jgi:hypothetical protein